MTYEPGHMEILAAISGRLGIITLNRPNALNLAMVERLETILTDWAVDPAIDAVVIRSSNQRAFCAGGDMRSIGTLPNPEARMALGRAFFGTEYRVNHLISKFAKPFIALINGITMGGGLGISVHGSHRIVSEDLRMAMPETVLGLFPDVGATWFLSRCPGMIGRYLALIGPHIGAADALTAGLATHHVPGQAFAALVDDLSAAERLGHGGVDALIAAHVVTPEGGSLEARKVAINQLFAGTDLDVAMARIDAAAPDAEWVAEAQSVLRRACPISLRATWRRMLGASGQSIEQILKDDFRMAVRMVGGHDLAEGVRAILVDKDQAPHWRPGTLDEVTDADIEALLAPFPDTGPMAGETDLDLGTEAGRTVP